MSPALRTLLLFLFAAPCGLAQGIFPTYKEGSDTELVRTYGGELSRRDTLSGDWGGLRDDLHASGLEFEADLLHLSQGIVAGGLSRGWRHGGSVELLTLFSTEEAGWWNGGTFKLRAEARYGRSINENVGSLTAVDTDGLFPRADDREEAITHLSYSQFFTESLGFIVGKIDTLDRDQNEYASGRGKTQFLNSNLVFNPVTIRTVPFSTLGAGILYRPGENTDFRMFVMDTEDSALSNGFDTVDDDGTTIAAETRVRTEFGGKRGHQAFGYSWSNRDFALLDQDGRLITAPANLQRKKTSWALSYSFDQTLIQKASDPDAGLGVFGRFGFADEKTNPVEAFFSFGVGGKGVVPHRKNDSFGVAFYHVMVSDSLPRELMFQDSTGMEMYYNFAVTPWFTLTPDVQVLQSNFSNIDDAVVLGLRGLLTF